LVACYSAVIPLMKREFSSHDFILKLAETHQADYIDALAVYRNKPEPFRILHGRLAAALTRKQFKRLVQRNKPRDVVSRDIFGQKNKCAFWKNLTQP
jgi:hypothetical protein